MSSTDTDQLVIEAVENHYNEQNNPFYLAELGKFFRSENIKIPPGVRFKDYLKSRFYGRLVVVQDEDHPAKIAIAPPEKQVAILQQMSDQSSELLENSDIDYARLPLALVAAFCKIPLPNTQVYFRITRPFRYETHMRAPHSNYIEIEEQFRPSMLAGKSVHDLSYVEKRSIYKLIEEWATAKSVDLRDLYYDRGVKQAKPREGTGSLADNALQRLINAQEPELRERFRIPGDIASTLLQLP